MKNKGHIPEDLYEELGFSPDINYARKKVDKSDGITQEMRHHAKILSHTFQRNLRQKKEDDCLSVIKKKADHELIMRNLIINR